MILGHATLGLLEFQGLALASGSLLSTCQPQISSTWGPWHRKLRGAASGFSGWLHARTYKISPANLQAAWHLAPPRKVEKSVS